MLKKEPHGVNLPYLVSKFCEKLGLIDGQSTREFAASDSQLKYHAVYMRVSRYLKRLADAGLINLVKHDGLWFIEWTDDTVDLILRHSETQTLREIVSLRVHPLRLHARRVLRLHKSLDDRLWLQVSTDFLDYMDDVGRRVIVLRHVDKGYYVAFRYETRFHKLRKVLSDYDKLWLEASKVYKVGVFLTLTTDPKRFPSLIAMSKHVHVAFNRFMSWASRRVGFRPPYVSILEFCKDGKVHLHVVLFGIGRLASKFDVSRFWSRTGQGRVTYLYKIVNNNGKWVWVKKRPNNTRSDVATYLRKYLAKAIHNVEHVLKDGKVCLNFLALYWATNKRFFTYSRQILGFIKASEEPIIHVAIYEFIGSFHIHEIPDVVYFSIVNRHALRVSY